MWRSVHFDRFFTLLGGMTRPSGWFDDDREPNPALGGRRFVSTPPGTQLGTGTVSLYGGLLYSQQFGGFWLHGQALYGIRTNLATVLDRRFLNALGGNSGLRLPMGLPVSEDLNAKALRTRMGQTVEQVQLGNGFFANAVANCGTRFNFLE